MLIDFHTHQLPADNRTSALVNISLPLAGLNTVAPVLRFSAGIHPWQLVDRSASKLDCLFEQLKQAVVAGEIEAIGECGLDRTISIPLEEQSIVFEPQIRLAKIYHLPLIIHCVRAYAELISLVKTYAPSCPWIIHGFNGNTQQLEQFLKYDIFYYSFGSALLKQPNKFAPLLQMVPPSHLLLETDDSDTNIMDIYHQTAKLCGCSYNVITKQMTKNWITLFK